jgi:isoleucyl-tRNA synthetase
MDYKDTLLLPKTKFPMRGNLPHNEPKRYTAWYSEKNVYEKMKQKRTGAESFTLHDGPPYANGNIHIGHALNKILKDIIVKTHYFSGQSVRFTPGWDCHGLPIEQQVEKKLGKAKKDALPITKIRELCREHATKFIDIQREEFKTLGVIADWEKPYLTMDYKFEANIYRTLTNIAHKGLLVERSKPVYWSWAAQTALAEAEVEYEDKTSPSIFVAFALDSEGADSIDASGSKIIIWTTTPWTLPANTGIALNPDEHYVVTEDNFIVAKKLHASLVESGVIAGAILKEIDPKVLERKTAINPLNGRSSTIVLADHVVMESGSGAVHTAPGHGEDDYRVGLEYDLEVIMPVDESGRYDETLINKKLFFDPDPFVGMNVFKANEPILELLGDALLQKTEMLHSYPHCWRTHQPIIFRATKQWFVSMDKPFNKEGKTLRDVALENINGVTFYPDHGINRLRSMIEGRPDWCISRQRDWGVPIAFFRDKSTKEPIFDEKVVNYIAMIFEQRGADAWWDMSIAELLYPGSGLEPENLEKVTDILDVWFDSGSTWRAVMASRNYDAGDFPCDMYLEGSDQHRGWFQSSQLISSAVKEISPYKNILTHGFTVDAKGEKMSKSKGNVVAPADITKQFGSEILRLWVALSDFSSDLKISENIIKQIAEQYKKLRNTIRFLLANIDDLETIAPVETYGELDRWILQRAHSTFSEFTAHTKNYEYAKAYSALNHFVVGELSGIYMDISKDRLYCCAKDDPIRVASQSVMALILRKLLELIAPVLTYTVDETLEYAPAVVKEESDDVFDLLYTPLEWVESSIEIDHLLAAREKFYELVDGFKKEKVIKSTLELVIYTDSKEIQKLSRVDAEDWFVVSKVIGHDEADELALFEIEGAVYKILRANRAKCPRCWKQRSRDENSLCERCSGVV